MTAQDLIEHWPSLLALTIALLMAVYFIGFWRGSVFATGVCTASFERAAKEMSGDLRKLADHARDATRRRAP